MKKVLISVISAIMVGTMVVGCGNGSANPEDSNKGSASEAAAYEAVKVTHDLGEVTITDKPESVVVFDFGALDTLDALGVEVAGVVKASLPSYLSEYNDDKYGDIGGLKEPDLEGIYELEPDLIIISGRQADFYEDLSEIAPTISVAIDNSKYIESIKSNISTLADIFEVEEKANELIAEIDNRAKEVSEEVQREAEGKKSLVILTNDGNISAYGPGSRFALVDALGFEAVDDTLDNSTHGQSIGYEYISEKNPDYIFVIDRSTAVGTEGASSAKQSLENDLVKSTNAYKEGNIIYLDSTYWYLAGGGVNSLQAMIDEVYTAVK
ncbi:MAG: siderophore ABC transporter substrate-binding protein [Clostridiaceae bacterium]